MATRNKMQQSNRLPLNACFVSQWRFNDLDKMPGKPISEAKRLSKELRKVVFFCYNDSNRYLSKRTSENMYVHTVPLNMSNSLIHTLVALPTNLVIAGIFLARIIDEYKIDFIRADNIILGGIPTLIAHLLRRTRFAIWLAGSEETVISMRYGNGFIARTVIAAFGFLRKLILKRALFVMSVSRQLAEHDTSRYRDKVIITPNFVDLELFRPKENSHYDGSLNLLYVGRLEVEKGVTFLIDAFQNLDSELNVRLLIAGFGSLKEEIDKAAAKNSRIDYLGSFSHDEMPKVYEKADVLVLPSLTEGMPAAILEALSSGLPVIASNVGQIPYVVRNGIEGILFHPGDMGGFQRAIIELAQDTRKLNEMKQKTRERAIDVAGNYVQFHRALYKKFVLDETI